MRVARPPRLATWLLPRLGVNESILGDLVERYPTRSSTWFWRQALIAILVGALKDVRDHKLMSMRGIVSGFVILLLSILVATRSSPLAGRWFWNWTVEHDLDTLRSLWFRYGLHLQLMTCAGCAASGWTIGRFHRNSLIVVYLVSVWLVNAAAFYLLSAQLWLFVWQSVWVRRIPLMTLLFVAMPISILLGGLYAARPAHDDRHFGQHPVRGTP